MAELNDCLNTIQQQIKNLGYYLNPAVSKLKKEHMESGCSCAVNHQNFCAIFPVLYELEDLVETSQITIKAINKFNNLPTECSLCPQILPYNDLFHTSNGSHCADCEGRESEKEETNEEI